MIHDNLRWLGIGSQAVTYEPKMSLLLVEATFLKKRLRVSASREAAAARDIQPSANTLSAGNVSRLPHEDVGSHMCSPVSEPTYGCPSGNCALGPCGDRRGWEKRSQRQVRGAAKFTVESPRERFAVPRWAELPPAVMQIPRAISRLPPGGWCDRRPRPARRQPLA